MTLTAAGSSAVTAAVTLESTGDPERDYRRQVEAVWEQERDRWGRPLVRQLDGTDIGYRRASSYGAPLEDPFRLDLWKLRQVAMGMTLTPALTVRVAALAPDLEDDNAEVVKAAREELDAIAQDAMRSAGAMEKADIGTALHRICERIDRGQDPGVIPPAYEADIAAYVDMIRAFDVLSIERIVVQDDYRIGGKLDRIVRLRRPMTVRKGKTRDGVWSPAVILPAGAVVLGDQKGVALTEQLPTPFGWTTMGDVRVGDRVLGSDGRPCRVTVKSATKRIGTYVVTFDDKSQIVCDPEHIWWASGGHHGKDQAPRPVGIEEIRNRLRSRGGSAWWRVPVAEPLELPDRELPIDPYLLGCWLGDGTAMNGEITKDDELFAVLAGDGHELGTRQVRATDVGTSVKRTVSGLVTKLRAADLLGHKAIPAGYLRASRAQRTRLLQGLMDTDGSWNIKRHRAVFTTTDKAMALQVEELVASLGQRPHLSSQVAHGFGKTVTWFGVEYTPVALVPFRLPRKAAKFEDDLRAGRITTTRAARRVITSVEPGPDVETACIAVDSPNRTYLCGERMIPTHNTAQTMDFAGAKFAVQAWSYANGTPYDPVAKAREPWGHEAPRRDWAVIFSTPSGQGTASLHWVDLTATTAVVEQAHQAHETRNKHGRKLTRCDGEDYAALAELVDTLSELHELHARAVADDKWTGVLRKKFTARRKAIESAQAVAS